MLNNYHRTVGESQPFLLSIDFTGKKEYNYVYEDGVIVRSTECDITVNGETVVEHRGEFLVLIIGGDCNEYQEYVLSSGSCLLFFWMREVN